MECVIQMKILFKFTQITELFWMLSIEWIKVLTSIVTSNNFLGKDCYRCRSHQILEIGDFQHGTVCSISIYFKCENWALYDINLHSFKCAKDLLNFSIRKHHFIVFACNFCLCCNFFKFFFCFIVCYFLRCHQNMIALIFSSWFFSFLTSLLFAILCCFEI